MLVLGIGQAGGNLAEELYKKGFNVIAINTSVDDLNALDIDQEFKFHIKNANGTAKNRDLSKKLAQSVAQVLIDLINQKYTSMKYIHLMASLGGGTGGGSIASIANMLQSVFNHKFISLTAILPSTFENIRLKNNALEAYSELAAIQDKVGPCFILTNEKVEKFRVNKMHCDVLDDLVNLRSSNKKGSLDAKELEEIMTTKAIILPHRIEQTKSGNEVVPIECYAAVEGNAKLTALSLSKTFRQEELRKFESYKGINISSVATRNDDKNYAFYCSIDFNKSAIVEISNRLNEEVKIIKQQREIKENIEIDTFDLSLTISKVNSTSNKTTIFGNEHIKDTHEIEEKSSKKIFNLKIEDYFR